MVRRAPHIPTVRVVHTQPRPQGDVNEWAGDASECSDLPQTTKEGAPEESSTEDGQRCAIPSPLLWPRTPAEVVQHLPPRPCRRRPRRGGSVPSDSLPPSLRRPCAGWPVRSAVIARLLRATSHDPRRERAFSGIRFPSFTATRPPAPRLALLQRLPAVRSRRRQPCCGFELAGGRPMTSFACIAAARCQGDNLLGRLPTSAASGRLRSPPSLPSLSRPARPRGRDKIIFIGK